MKNNVLKNDSTARNRNVYEGKHDSGRWSN